MTILLDVHAHLDHLKFREDLYSVVDRARKAGVKAIITSGVNHATNLEALKIAERYRDIVKCSLGLYPVDALVEEEKNESALLRDRGPLSVDDELKFIESKKKEIIAVGEVGLDYKFGTKHSDSQRETFLKVIELCERIKKPIIVHTRKAEEDCITVLETSRLKKVVLHCFSGNKKLIKRAADKGWSFSIPPIIVRLQHFQTLAEMVNINQLLTETDCPYLSPQPGQRNEPAFVLETVKKIAEIKKFDVEETANSIWMNYQNMFL